MAVNGVGIKVGQVWRSRNGSQWEIIGPYEWGDWAWLAKQIGGASVGSETNFSEDGLFWPKTSGLNKGPHESDLVFLVSDPDIGAERRQQQAENSPLRRKGDYPPVPADLPDLAAPPAEFAASVPGMLDETNVPGIFSVRREVPADPQRTDEIELHVRVNADEAVAELDRLLQPQSALDVQIGGGHYKQFAIQPVEFIHKNGIPFVEGNCIKYLARWRDKGGIEDLKKVKHYIDLLIEMESKK